MKEKIVLQPEQEAQLVALLALRIALATEMNNYQTAAGEDLLAGIDDDIAILEGRQPIDRSRPTTFYEDPDGLAR